MKTKFKEIRYSQLKEEDAVFSYFTYNGKQYIDLRLDELSFLQYPMQDNCLRLKSLKTKEIAVTEKYPIENARASIKTLFSFKDLKNISVTDLEGINERLKECERWLNEYYVGLGKPIRHYNRIKRRKHKL